MFVYLLKIANGICKVYQKRKERKYRSVMRSYLFKGSFFRKAGGTFRFK